MPVDVDPHRYVCPVLILVPGISSMTFAVSIPVLPARSRKVNTNIPLPVNR